MRNLFRCNKYNNFLLIVTKKFTFLLGRDRVSIGRDKKSPSTGTAELSTSLRVTWRRTKARNPLHRRSHTHQRGHCRLLDRVLRHKMYVFFFNKSSQLYGCGLLAVGDLDPLLSRYTLTPLKLVYKKLRVLVDRGCVFIGHGLSKDFRIISMPLHYQRCRVPLLIIWQISSYLRSRLSTPSIYIS